MQTDDCYQSNSRKKNANYHLEKLEVHDFCGIAFMFLTTPTVDELKEMDLPDLVDMLAKQATEYSQLIKREGASAKTVVVKEMILNIQKAIDAKKAVKKSSVAK